MRATIAGIVLAILTGCYVVPAGPPHVDGPSATHRPAATQSPDERRLELARSLVARGDLGHAQRLFLEVAEEKPPSPLSAQALLGLGEVLWEQAAGDPRHLEAARAAFSAAEVAPGVTDEIAEEARDRIGQMDGASTSTGGW